MVKPLGGLRKKKKVKDFQSFSSLPILPMRSDVAKMRRKKKGNKEETFKGMFCQLERKRTHLRLWLL